MREYPELGLEVRGVAASKAGQEAPASLAQYYQLNARKDHAILMEHLARNRADAAVQLLARKFGSLSAAVPIVANLTRGGCGLSATEFVETWRGLHICAMANLAHREPNATAVRTAASTLSSMRIGSSS